MNKQKQEAFYKRCADILNIPHTYNAPVRRNRWTNRRLGNGRFPGFGLIRCYGTSVMITTRAKTVWLPSFEAAIDYLEKWVKEQNPKS